MGPGRACPHATSWVCSSKACMISGRVRRSTVPGMNRVAANVAYRLKVNAPHCRVLLQGEADQASHFLRIYAQVWGPGLSQGRTEPGNGLPAVYVQQGQRPAV